MPAIERIGDLNTAGAPIKGTPQQSVFANNILVAVNGSPVAKHGKGSHSSPRTANGSQNVFINHIPINRVGDGDTCGHSRSSGSPNVFVN